ncbi:MAG: glycosyltransferase family 2 protein [Patescibacteria group bacterium]|uniref:Glycosyltransferase family 2 protein n=1 Tax=candidate division WWE3 bacterium TaxID=2053526 RepID=A0A955EDS2_UNCKA|nr:glycosyltransferase family 2 protein [candidate division WWE3 bacterium]
MSNKLDISVVIINYNTSEVLKECLTNLFSLKDGLNMEVIVVDNASPDDSVQMVKSNFAQVKLIEQTQNKGLAYASNVGLREAKSDYIAYLGSDAFPKDNTLSQILSYMHQHKDVGAVTPKLVLRDGSLDMDAHRAFPTPLVSFFKFSGLSTIFKNSTYFNKYFLAGADLNSPHEIDLCIAHFMVIKRSVLEQLHGWDEDYFLYGEDVDMCFRIKKAGYKIVYMGNLEAVHYKGVTVGVRASSANISKASKETRLRSRKNSVDAMEIFYKKHFTHYPKPITWTILTSVKILGFLRILKEQLTS